MSAPGGRHTADERRGEILAAAVTRFGSTGLHGTSTETIARDVGVSQPYVFRLFGTKKELFMEAVEWGFRHTLETIRGAARDASDPADAFRRIGDAYAGLIADRHYLDLQMQAYAACDDPDIREVVERGFGALVTEVGRGTGASPEQLAVFLGRGMLLNVMAAMGVLDREDGWPAVVREGCGEL
jgi:AcrR family transcriptional regulator